MDELVLQMFDQGAADRAAVLFALIVLFASVACLLMIRRPAEQASNPDYHDGVHGLCNGCWTERWDLKELHCRGCRDAIDMRAW